MHLDKAGLDFSDPTVAAEPQQTPHLRVVTKLISDGQAPWIARLSLGDADRACQ
jgi:hypothetical protein